MILRPPRLPRPCAAQRSFRTPPDPRITLPACGFSISADCNARYSSSGNSSWASLENILVSMKLYIGRVYGTAVGRQCGETRYLCRNEKSPAPAGLSHSFAARRRSHDSRAEAHSYIAIVISSSTQTPATSSLPPHSSKKHISAFHPYTADTPPL